MSTLKELKEYLVGDGGYLLNPDNNGKTVMLSGAWGSGKTYFWLENIKQELTEKNQKNIYISLYGKESIAELKFEVLREAYNLEVKEDIISKTASMLSSIAPGFGEKSLVDGFDKLNKKAKDEKAKEILKSGSIICLDDFERKSKNIDLNDLFGYISQLALEFNCKVVIILNSDVFEGEEANVFKTVKEKTVNKFFYFEPTIEELCNSIYESNEKYKALDEYKAEILEAIKETEELNARIYIQVLDNCLEWVEEGCCSNTLRPLILNTTCFMKNHFVLEELTTDNVLRLKYKVMKNYPTPIIEFFSSKFSKSDDTKMFSADIRGMDIIFLLKQWVCNTDSTRGFRGYEESLHQEYLLWIDNHEDELKELYKYGYLLYAFESIDNSILSFIKTGILSKKNKEPSS